jgi:hypothetical protein
VKKIVFILILSAVISPAFSQNTPAPKVNSSKQEKKNAKKEKINQLMRQEEEGEIIFHKQSAFGFKIPTDGYGIIYEMGRFKSNRISNLYQIEFSEKKHPKEKKQGASSNQYQVNSVVPGKLNNFYQVKFGFAQQRIIGGKGNKNGVAVGAVYGAGLSLGLLKPYYVDVREGTRVTYDKIVDSAYIPLGASGFTVGWGEVKIRPGLNTKVGLRFDYGRLNETVTAIEVGLNAEFYPQEIPQMLYVEEKQFFFSAYLSLLLGRRK